MAGTGPVSGVDPALSRVQIEAQYQVQTAKRHREVVSDMGKAAIRLINSALASAQNEGENVNTVA